MNMEEEKEEGRHRKVGPGAAAAWHSQESRAEEGREAAANWLPGRAGSPQSVVPIPLLQ